MTNIFKPGDIVDITNSPAVGEDFRGLRATVVDVDGQGKVFLRPDSPPEGWHEHSINGSYGGRFSPENVTPVAANNSTAVDPGAVKVGDRVIAQNYKQMGLASGIRAPRATTVTEVSPRPNGGVLIRVEGAPYDYGFEWFRPLPTEGSEVVEEGASTLLVDDTGVGSPRYWIFSEKSDAWACFYLDELMDDPDFPDLDDVDEMARGGCFVGFDEGAAGVIRSFRLADVAPVRPARPRATLLFDTSKEYAAESNSRKGLLNVEDSRILHEASLGHEVDVFDFRKAATQALSAAATRSGTSSGRREYAKKARHLIYWADSILESHIDGLPPMASGARSPKIKELKEELQRANAELAAEKSARMTWEEKAQELSDAVTAAQGRASEAEAKITRLLAQMESDDSEKASLADAWEEALVDASALKFLLGYIESELPEASERVDAFLIGIYSAFNEA